MGGKSSKPALGRGGSGKGALPPTPGGEPAPAEAHSLPAGRSFSCRLQQNNEPRILTVGFPNLYLSSTDKRLMATFPIKYLRGYGQLQDIFSFETGRKCPGGAQTYFFVIDNDADLFLALNEAIADHNHGVGGDRYDHLPAFKQQEARPGAGKRAERPASSASEWSGAEPTTPTTPSASYEVARARRSFSNRPSFSRTLSEPEQPSPGRSPPALTAQTYSTLGRPEAGRLVAPQARLTTSEPQQPSYSTLKRGDDRGSPADAGAYDRIQARRGTDPVRGGPSPGPRGSPASVGGGDTYNMLSAAGRAQPPPSGGDAYNVLSGAGRGSMSSGGGGGSSGDAYNVLSGARQGGAGVPADGSYHTLDPRRRGDGGAVDEYSHFNRAGAPAPGSESSYHVLNRAGGGGGSGHSGRSGYEYNAVDRTPYDTMAPLGSEPTHDNH